MWGGGAALPGSGTASQLASGATRGVVGGGARYALNPHKEFLGVQKVVPLR